MTNHSSGAAAPKYEEDESQWTDACIRWTEDDLEPHMRPSWSRTHNSNNNTNGNPSLDDDDGDMDDDEDEGFLDPFADPDPTQDFTFEYSIPSTHVSTNDTGVDNFNSNSCTTTGSKVQIVVQGYKADSDETWESTGLTLWKATHSLNDYILQHYQQWQQQIQQQQQQEYSILELGAGLGVCGILASRLLSSSSSTTIKVCLTDGDTQALALLRENVKRNHCSAETTTVKQLLWGRENAQRFALASSTTTSTSTNGTFQIILASDIIYAPQVLVPLWETIQVLLAPTNNNNISTNNNNISSSNSDTDNDTSSSKRSNSTPTFILAFAKRKVPVQLEHVLQTAKDYGFEWTIPPMMMTGTRTATTDTTAANSPEEEQDVFLYEFRRLQNHIDL